MTTWSDEEKAQAIRESAALRERGVCGVILPGKQVCILGLNDWHVHGPVQETNPGLPWSLPVEG